MDSSDQYGHLYTFVTKQSDFVLYIQKSDYLKYSETNTLKIIVNQSLSHRSNHQSY